MNAEEKQNSFSRIRKVGKITRREFLKSTGFITGGTALGMVMADSVGGVKEIRAEAVEDIKNKPNEWSFELPPSPIAKSEITEVINAEVVVLGAGIGGLSASLSAAQAGAKTILLEKTNKITVHGGWNGAINSRLQKKLGISIDSCEVTEEIMRWGAYKPNYRLIKLWADKSGEVMDWVLDMTDASGLISIIEPGHRMDQGPFKHYRTAHLFMTKDDQPPFNTHLLSLLKEKAIAAGVKMLFETPAVQLIRKNNGKISGVIANGLNGYLQFNSNAVVLCTGGYQNDPEMLAKYIPEASNIVACWNFPKAMTGDGHKMGMWIGAAMDPLTQCPMLWDGGIPDAFMYPLTRLPWLNVNVLGERFANEDSPYGLTARADMRQPEHMKWVIWDSKWTTEAFKFKGDSDERMEGPMTFHRPKQIESLIERGIIITASTIEELGEKMKVPKEVFMSTVRRYNELVRTGKDLDFGKPSYMLTTIEKKPFYAVKTGPALVVTCSGLEINTEIQVLDNSREIIPGLYAAGDVSGGFFANDYPVTILGTANSRALTFGRLAGLKAAKEKHIS